MSPRPRPRSTPSLYSLSGVSSLTSIVSTPTNPSPSEFKSRSRSPSPSFLAPNPNPNPNPNDNNPTLPPSEFIFPIPFSGSPSETSPLLRTRHRSSCNGFKPCTCNYANHKTHILKTTSTTQSSSIQFRYCSIQRSSLLNIQIISGVLFTFCLAVIVLSPLSTRAEDGTSILEQDLHSLDQHVPLTALHILDKLDNTNSSIQTQTQAQEHNLGTPQLKGIEFAIVCFAIFFICSIIRAASYVMSRWGLCFGGEGSDGNGGVFGDEEEMIGYGGRREEEVDEMV